MAETLSPYTIDVGPCQPDGTREIFLQHHQRPCFSTTHREVLRVCLAKWPSRVSVEAAAVHTTDLEEAEAIRTRRTDAAYQSLLEVGDPAGVPGSTDSCFSSDQLNSLVSAQTRRTNATAAGAPTQEDNPTLENYLCVFHREELADQYGRYTFVQPQTICTAYRVQDTTALELVLHTISPRDIAASAVGSGGVFIHGRRQTSKGGGGGASWGNTLISNGVLYKPAADTWWMSSPLSVTPVYVAVNAVAVSDAAPAGAEQASVSRNSPVSPPPQSVNAPPDFTASTAEACVAASAPLLIDSGDSARPASPSSSPRQGSPATEAATAPHVEGRTAQGQFDFPRSRSATPKQYSPLPSTLRGAEVHGAAASTSTSASSFPARPAAPPSNTSKSKFVTLDAVVLAQLPLFEPPCTTSLRSSMAVVRTASDELGLALLTPLYAVDAMLWHWWPHRVRLSQLASSASALSVVASPHANTRQQLIFLYDAHYRRLRVLRSPDLHTREGELELLFSFPCGDLPFVFPCLHTSTHPAPIAVCNYPRANCISLYDVVALHERPSPDTVALQIDLGTHQAVHADGFGEVRPLSDTGGSHRRDASLSRAEASDLAKMDECDGAGLCDGSSRKKRSAKAWGAAADAANFVAHPIRSLLYHYGGCLVLQYDWPSEAVPTAAAGGTCGTEVSPLEMQEGGRERRCRRRCEGTISYTLKSPYRSDDDQPLLLFTLEALSAAVGPRAVASIEYELFREAWRCSCVPDARADPFQTCTFLLKKLCVPRTQKNTAADVDAGRPLRAVHDATARRAEPEASESLRFVDPSLLTLQQVRNALVSSRQCPAELPFAAADTQSMKRAAPPLSWSPQQAGLALVSLHLLFESCRLQEPLWILLPPLAELNYGLSMQMLWPSYVEFYRAMVAWASSGAAESFTNVTNVSSFTDCLPPDSMEQHFEYLQPGSEGDAAPSSSLTPTKCHTTSRWEANKTDFEKGDAPNLFRTLSMLAVGTNDVATHASILKSWPMLRRVPESHPIAFANQLVLVYRNIFGSSVAVQCTQTQAISGRSTSSNGNISGLGLRWWERVCSQLLQQNMSAHLVRQVLNTGVAYPLLEAITKGREQAEATWPAVLLDLVGRRDRCPPLSFAAQLISAGQHVVEAAEENAVARQIRVALADDDGVSVRPDFRKTWRDTRLDVAQTLFNTVSPISLSGFEDRPEELTGALESLSSRARAMPLGRGMLTMCTQSFKVQDSIPIPPLNLNGRTNDGICIVNKSTEDLMWPLFHNGCAAGLRFLPLPPAFCAGAGGGDGGVSDANPHGNEAVPQGVGEDTPAAAAAQTITKQWVMYQTKIIGNAASRAGLLLATGILGHLTVLQRTDIFYLLISRQEQYVWREATTMAVMLGLSCSFCGTSNEAVFRCLSVHVQSLNPSAEDIEVSLDVQTAALVSMGLLCQQAPSNTFLVEVFLVEISRLPTDEHCSKREGYVLGAGFGLGQLLLGVGAAHGVPHVEDRLLAFMNGAPRKSALSTREGVEYFEETMGRGEAGHFLARALLSQDQREASFNACASVYEGDCYNVFVSGPAAAVALGFMYLQTDSSFIAAKVAPPNRRTAMQRLTPLLCHLRSTMSSLICWSSIAPTRAWLHAQLPSSLLLLTTASVPGVAAQQRNYLLMNLAHCLAGHVMALGLRYAGTLDTQVRDVIFAELQGFLSGHIGSTQAPIPAVQRVTGAYETCTLTCACALSLVMAGTGDLKVFAALQHLHRRTNVAYGSHMSVSMSMGLLFLGSGRLTLSNNIASVAALFMAFYPLWPSDAEDNTHHLQALRHLYGLAVVPRVMEAVDAVSQQPVSVPVRIVLRPTEDIDATVRGARELMSSGSGTASVRRREIRTRTPCLYPPVELIERVEIDDPQHYPLTFNAVSKELMQSASMEFRVMAKGGAFRHGTHHARRSLLESRLLNWLHRLFHQPSTTTAEALTVIESVRLVHHVQRRLAATPMSGDTLLSGDFSVAVREAMEKRYGFLFLHRVGSSVDGGAKLPTTPRTYPPHPLYQLIIEGKPYRRVLESVAAHPRGTAAFPCDFTSLLSLPYERQAGVGEEGEGDDEAAAAAMDCDVRCGVDRKALHRWIAEALHYYGLRPSELLLIREGFSAFLTSVCADNAAESVIPSPAPLTSSVARLTCLLRLQATTHLSFHTLERVWACCAS